MSKNIKLNETEYSGVSTVQLPTTDGGTASFKDTDEIVTPSGTKTITENGTFDVANFASALVNVATGGSGGLPIHTGTHTVSNPNTQHTVKHNLNLSSYVYIFWLDGMADYIADTTDTFERVVSGIGAYNFDHFLESVGQKTTGLVFGKSYKQSTTSWGMGYSIGTGVATDANKMDLKTTANIATGTYKYIIIDTSSLTGVE